MWPQRVRKVHEVQIFSFLALVSLAGLLWAQADNQPPTTPQDFFAYSASITRADMHWQPATDNSGLVTYIVYRDGVEIARTQNTTYTDISVTPHHTYTYHVVAVDAAGNESLPSRTSTVTIGGWAPPNE